MTGYKMFTVYKVFSSSMELSAVCSRVLTHHSQGFTAEADHYSVFTVECKIHCLYMNHYSVRIIGVFTVEDSPKSVFT